MPNLFASGDPMNITLAIVWSGVMLWCLALTWYSYFRWRAHPDDSLSHNIAVFMQQYKMRFILGFVFGITIGVMVGVVLGMFAGHWFWPVELERIPTLSAPEALPNLFDGVPETTPKIKRSAAKEDDDMDGYDGSGYWWDHDAQGHKIDPHTRERVLE